MTTSQLSHSYSDDVFDKRIAILGPCPPPRGGVSVHIQRVIHKLKQQRNQVENFNTVVEYRYTFFPYYAVRLMVWLLSVYPQKVYYHTTYLSNCLPELWLLVKLKKLIGYHLIFVEHDCRHLYQRTAYFKKKYTMIMKKVDQLILIGSQTQQSYQDMAIDFPCATAMEGAFLPPNMADEEIILKTYPPSLHAFMQNHTPLILANAFQLSRIHGKDLYGIDQCLQMLSVIQQEHARLGLVLVLAQVGDAAYFRQLCFMAHRLNIAEHLYILTQQRELWPLLKRVDLFVRPTLSDGASVSVQEALHFGTKTVASDVCLRPAGTVLYSGGDVNDFAYKVKESLHQIKVK